MPFFLYTLALTKISNEKFHFRLEGVAHLFTLMNVDFKLHVISNSYDFLCNLYEDFLKHN